MIEDQIAFVQTKNNAVNMATISLPHDPEVSIRCHGDDVAMIIQHVYGSAIVMISQS